MSNKYQRKVRGFLVHDGEHTDEIVTIVVDIYDVLVAFGVTNPALQHAIKKQLMPGVRGYKTTIQDLREAFYSIERAMQIEVDKEDRIDD